MTATTQEPHVIDLRSDTVTKPTYEMLQEMIKAPVGDDVYIVRTNYIHLQLTRSKDDPTVIQLEETVAKMCGKEAALFVCSGVMGNQLCLKVHLGPLTEVILDSRAHIYRNELGGIAYHSGASVTPLSHVPPLTYITAEQIEQRINTTVDYHTCLTKLIALENTLAGTIFPVDEMKRIRDVANKHKIAMHLDGARLWNAHVATGVSLQEYGKYFDSMSLCFSKAMGAPIGSVIVGTKEFIGQARQFRKLFGGGWRQAGILASCCLFSLKNILPIIHRDHENAQKLSQGLIDLGFIIDVNVETNMVFANSSKLAIPLKSIADILASKHIKISTMQLYTCRMVLHHQISSDDVDTLLNEIRLAISEVQNQ